MFPASSVKTQTSPSFGCFTTHVAMRMSCWIKKLLIYSLTRGETTGAKCP